MYKLVFLGMQVNFCCFKSSYMIFENVINVSDIGFSKMKLRDQIENSCFAAQTSAGKYLAKGGSRA